MEYSAIVPHHVTNKLPECLQTEDNQRFFRAVYKNICGQLSVDMEDVHPSDDTYMKMALYVVTHSLHSQTGEPVYFNICNALENAAMDIAMVEGIDLDAMKGSRMCYVPAQIAPQAIAAGIFPDNTPIALPYCDTYEQALQMLSIAASPKFTPSSRYGVNEDALPCVPHVNEIYAVLASPARIKILQASVDNDVVNAFPQGFVNPTSVSEVDCVIPGDVLHARKAIHTDIAFGNKPPREMLQREMEMRINDMFTLQSALTKTHATLRQEIEMYGADNAAFRLCFSKDDFLSESPFEKTVPERMVQLALRELRDVCSAGTLRYACEFKDNFLHEFDSTLPSFAVLAEGLQKHLHSFKDYAVHEEQHYFDGVISAAKHIADISANEKAEALLHLDDQLSQEQRKFLDVVSKLTPEYHRSEFIVRTADQMTAGLSNVAATKLIAIAMAREAESSGSPITADAFHQVAENASSQYAIHQAATHDDDEWLSWVTA